MKDATDRIVGDGKSILLSQLADKVVKNKPRSTPQSSHPSEAKPAENSFRENMELVTNVNQSLLKEGVLLVKEDSELYEVNEATIVVILCDGTCNHRDIEECDLSACVGLKELMVGNDCLRNVRELKLSEFDSLENISFGSKCFSNTSGGMEVIGCGALKKMVIGGMCCINWVSFTLKDCGVEEVRIGDGCFVNCENTVFESCIHCID